MRPTRLELDGFASFREPTTVEFADTDLFVLSGPTGAGKSSVVDAITFALYGVVARYDDRRRVAPVISQGRAEARVRLDFAVGAQQYSAVRVVRRTKTGAATKEARLERWRGDDPDDTVVEAGTADELTARVESLLGLSFDHFSTCVVLPQGDFSEFLHAKPGDRQDLLVELLDLDVYRKVGQAARERARSQQQRVELLRQRLDGEFTEATEDAAKQAMGRVEQLERLLGDVDDWNVRLVELEQEGQQQSERERTTTARLQLLEGLDAPPDVAELASGVAAARERLTAAEAQAEQAADAVEAAEQVRRQAGEVGPLAQQQQRLRELATVRERQRDLADTRAAVDAAVARARTRRDDTAAAVAAARHALDVARRQDLAATLAADLHAGDDCPVCLRRLEEDPPHRPADAVATAEQALTEAEADRERAETRLRDAERRQTDLDSRLGQLNARIGEIQAAIAAAASSGVPDTTDAVDAALERLATLDAAVTEARAQERRAREQRRQASEALQTARTRLDGAWRAFDETWRGVSELSPPAVSREDLEVAWQELVSWARTKRPQLADETRAAQQAVRATRRQYAALLDEMLQALTAADVTPGQRSREAARDAVLREHQQARSQVERIQQLLAEAARVRTELGQAEQDRRVAHALGQHLDAKRFERWLMNRALERLVIGATRILRELSGGSYSLALDDQGGFLVIDHRNADEPRSARTLSGGETFLASLALALALSEHVADLAAQGAARLESLILDEGFGTLDAETLDVVASALEDLGSAGRMVGVITHVPSLAERLPVRYEVRKIGGSSTIERVTA